MFCYYSVPRILSPHNISWSLQLMIELNVMFSLLLAKFQSRVSPWLTDTMKIAF